jgi:uncharacterized 2Fe-2S/4Fe-4S cluster protein (DUF4445 family)
VTRMHKVLVRPSGHRGKVADGTTLRTALRGLGTRVESICAENATCGKCKVLIEDSSSDWGGIDAGQHHVSPPGPEEIRYFEERPEWLLKQGLSLGRVRLACQARVQGDLVVTVPEESLAERQIVRKSATERRISLRPALRKYLVELNPPSLSNAKADWERLASGIATSMDLARQGESGLPRPEDLTIDRICLQGISQTLRESGWRVTVSVWQDHEVVRVEPGFNDRAVGAAVDIGTTTVALYLCDLSSGGVVATEADMNAQIDYGEDVMSRIHFGIKEPDGVARMHKAIIRTINQLMAQAARSAMLDTRDIVDLVVVGNTTMQHLFLGLSPANLGAAPFAPVISRGVDVKARELRLLMNPSAYVHVLPAIASFIGADTTGVLLAEEPYSQDENWLIIDIGTNAELVLGNRQRLVCTSTPTGPALEGAHIEHGMRAAPGAIEHIRIDDDSLRAHWRIIGEEEWDRGQPKGICGSAVVDAAAELRRVGAMDQGGRLHANPGSSSIRNGNQSLEYLVAPANRSKSGADLCLTQKDIRQIQLAKSALYVAAQSLLAQVGIPRPDKVVLAGAFGSYMNRHNALAIGMLPAIPVEDVFVVGNAAGDGARIALLNIDKRREAAEIARRVTRYELPTDPEFQSRFISALAFPEVDERDNDE